RIASSNSKKAREGSPRYANTFLSARYPSRGIPSYFSNRIEVTVVGSSLGIVIDW
ncbi:7986_t:CDS:1, partial [Acaulospora colombiana]